MSHDSSAHDSSATGTLEAAFDIKTSPISSYAALCTSRADLFENAHALQSFRNRLAELSGSGEEGRRKGLGLWMAGDSAAAAAQLASFENDHVAAFTRAKSLMAIGKAQEAHAIFERLSKSFPDEARPRGGMIEARLEADLAAGNEEAARANLEKALKSAPAAFATSADGCYLQGRLHEMDHQYEAAVVAYDQSREADPTHRAALFRFAYVSERIGDTESALSGYQQLASMLPIDRNVLINMGMLLEDMGRDREACACYDVANRSFPTDARLRRYLEDARSGIDMYYDEDMERKEDRLNQILRIPITDFELSVRARNCLNKMNILTLGDLVRHSETELLAYKNFGETSLQEIKEILVSKGLRLGMGREEAVASIEAARRRTVTSDPNEVMNRPVSELELSIRCRRVVEAMGCLTAGDITQHSEDEFLGMPNFGSTSLQELKAKLSDLGLKLAPKQA
jgi:DNA-directed RNA polymerase subunit alpha